MAIEKERVLLVAIQTDESDEDLQYRLDELAALVDTAQGEVVGELVQKRETLNQRTAIGSGKVDELATLAESLNVDTIVFNHALSPSHVRNLQEVIDCKIIDRVQLILDIFAMRARSREGKLQVELAQLEYLLPRLSGQGKNLTRQGGGIGTRGPGETKLESDRRHIQRRMHSCKEQLAQVADHRQRTRQQRQSSSIWQVGLIGYTNAGKSTLLNRLTDANTYAQHQLFATLDPLTRQLLVKGQYPMTLTDTVGFIQDIPTQLIHAFRSTLEESRYVDLLLHVVDASAADQVGHEKTVYRLLDELDMRHIPMLTVYNKRDLASPDFHPTSHPHIVISALDDADIARLHDAIWEQTIAQMVPYHQQLALGQEQEKYRLQRETFITSESFDEENLCYHVQGYARHTK